MLAEVALVVLEVALVLVAVLGVSLMPFTGHCVTGIALSSSSTCSCALFLTSMQLLPSFRLVVSP